MKPCTSVGCLLLEPWANTFIQIFIDPLQVCQFEFRTNALFEWQICKLSIKSNREGSGMHLYPGLSASIV